MIFIYLLLTTQVLLLNHGLVSRIWTIFSTIDDFSPYPFELKSEIVVIILQVYTMPKIFRRVTLNTICNNNYLSSSGKVKVLM